MKFYIEPIGEFSNEIIVDFLNSRGSNIEITTKSDIYGRKHSVYTTSDHNIITCLKNSKVIKIGKDFKVYILRGDLLLLSYIDHKK